MLYQSNRIIQSKKQQIETRKMSGKSQAVMISVLLVWAFKALTLTLTVADAGSDSSISFAKKDHLFPELIKWHVYIVNGLSNDQNLLTSCKSKDDDLGIHNLSVGSNVTWSFRTDFFHSTLFSCSVSKGTASATFDVFWYDAHLFDKCNWKNCIWVARDDGIYLADLSQNLYELRYCWNQGM